MRVAISGAQSTGKTTLLEELKRYIDVPYIQGITRDLKSRGFKINREGDDRTQKAIMQCHVENLKRKNFISDRSILDGVVYTHYLYNHGKVSKDVYKYAVGCFDRYIGCYDLLFYIRPEFELVDDNVRDVDVGFRDEVVGLFEYYLKGLDYVVLKGSVSDRVCAVIRELRLRGLYT